GARAQGARPRRAARAGARAARPAAGRGDGEPVDDGEAGTDRRDEDPGPHGADAGRRGVGPPELEGVSAYMATATTSKAKKNAALTKDKAEQRRRLDEI